MKKTILRIDRMSCSACSNGLEKYLKKQNGIEDAVVNLVMATASITYNDDLNIHDIERFIEEAGFKSLGEEKISEEAKNDKDRKRVIILGIICGVLLINTIFCLFGIMIFDYNKYPRIYSIINMALTVPFLIYGKDIIKTGIKSILYKNPNMDSLITIGVITSLIYSLVSTVLIFVNKKYIDLYYESVIFVIYFVKLGRFISNISKDKAKSAIKGLVSITPNKAHLKNEDSYVDITIDEVKKDDILICLPGEKIAVDGTITKGSSTFDESFLTGESLPVIKKENSKVIAGSINHDTVIEYKAERIGKDSTISEIVRLVVEATNTKNKISRMVDKICSYFVPAVITFAFIAFIINLLITKNISISILRLVTVLVVACPCSLGLATPLALVVSVSNSAKKGILVKDSDTLEEIPKIDTIVFDKTGTLTNGSLSISRINNHSSLNEHDILDILVSMEKNSTHPISKGIMNYAKREKFKSSLDIATEELPGYGLKGRDKNTIYYACNKALLKKLDIINSYEEEENAMSKLGNSVIYLVRNNMVIATIGLKDTIRKESIKTIKSLKELKKDIFMLTGDNEITASEIAKELGIENVISNVSPQEKLNWIKDQISSGKHIMMVGDGTNDAPSLTTSNIGVSLSSGTDIASNAANIVLISNNLEKVENIIEIGNKTIRNIKQNLFWAFLYNILMLPVAAGFTPFKINPMIACIAMVLSSLTVTLNTLRLKK